jgi:hypothetical protein
MNKQVTIKPVTEPITKELVEPKKTTLKVEGHDDLKVSDFCKKGYWASFVYYRQGYMYFEVESWVKKNGFDSQLRRFMFPVEVADLGTATVNNIEKAITMMRYIRKALEDGTMIQVWPVPTKML